MGTCEPDSDVVRWGLHLLDAGDNHLYDSAYYASATQNEPTCYNEEFPRGDQFGNQYCNVENDEVIAYTLQEEFRRLAVAEASGSGHSDEEHQQASILAQDWLGPSGPDHEHEEVDDNSPSSCSSPDTTTCDEEESSYSSLELADESSSLDGEVGKRLIQMIPIPHVPRINGEIPSVDEATSDHHRLLARLELYDLIELKVQGDGNCQFRALSDQFYRTAEHHKFVREQVVNQLKADPDIYSGDGEWGDHVTLQAAADWYGVKICVFTSFKDTCFIEILPSVQKSERVIFLSFWAEVHYNSIYPEGDVPVSETKKKRRWWHFGNKH
ncbi:OVARIAN TUMOR DOMAIN-containing deubiquitinating enzyme 12-like isoform X2 [Nymphaea colorata]|uniref:OVARIAN TUMOR DOMAIN-containing deubiquitinating enzyme 12-like isoform X2 n=1 Tax=Nymphaea colorata TaxID=210225 RepID=UPI00129DC918|nr:OVARIAN TUMOR DOMAIN-containing deubiquitinating enzyme 12-like isoform X2 [Nymphaea colorata]